MTARRRYTATRAALVYSVEGGVPLATRSPYLPRGTLTGVDCPDCPSPAGKKCVSSTGKSMNQVHISRRRIAMRKYNTELQEKA